MGTCASARRSRPCWASATTSVSSSTGSTSPSPWWPAAVSCGGAWATEDDGATWTCRATGMRADYMPPERQGDPIIQDPHRLAHCAAAPDAQSWLKWETARNQEIRGRLQRGDADSIVNLILFGTSFTARPRLTVLSGPSGVGKSTVVAHMRQAHPEVWLSVSTTTRRPPVSSTPSRSRTARSASRSAPRRSAPPTSSASVPAPTSSPQVPRAMLPRRNTAP